MKTRARWLHWLCIILCVFLAAAMCFVGCQTASDPTDPDKDGGNVNEIPGDGDDEKPSAAAGYVNIRDYGVDGTTRTDCYAAFVQAALTGKSIYVPAGTYYVSGAIQLRNQNLFGDGMFQSYIVSTASDSSVPVLYLGRSCAVEDINIGFDPSLITGNETAGERAGIITGDNYTPPWPLQRGSQINRVHIANTGTAIYSPQSGTEEATSFSVAYTNLELQDFSFRGIDFVSKTRTGNVFSNIYMRSDHIVDSLFNMEGEESETTIIQLNLEHTKVSRAAISLDGCRALALSTLHIEGIELVEEDATFIYLENSSGRMDAVTVYYTAVDAADCSLFKIGDAVYDINESWQTEPPATLSKMIVGTLHLKGIHDPNVGIHGSRPDPGLNGLENFLFAEREANALGPYKLKIENYVYYTFQDDAAGYRAFATDGELTVEFEE